MDKQFARGKSFGVIYSCLDTIAVLKHQRGNDSYGIAVAKFQHIKYYGICK